MSVLSASVRSAFPKPEPAPVPSGTVRVTVTETELPLGAPSLAYQELLRDRPQHDVYLLESLDGPAADRRASVVGWDRLAELRLHADRVELDAPGALGEALARAVASVAGEPCATEDARRVWPLPDRTDVWPLLRRVQGAFEVDTEVPDSGFVFGFLTGLSYEAAWDMEQLPPHSREPELPRCTLALFRTTAWYDLERGRVRLLRASGPELPPDEGRLPQALVSGRTEERDPEVPSAPAPRSVRRTVDERTFAERVARCLRHIGIGDSYQIQIGHRIDVATDLTPYQVYQRLRKRNPSPYMYLAPWAGRTVVGASPELFLRIEDGVVSMRPIAGTAARGADPDEDARRVAELSGSSKEQAEHVMLVDLCRNDIGRVCEPGTLAVGSMMRAEPFASVHHLVSTVTGRLRPAADVWTAVRAAFPAGTMTGAPKVRAMEIIHDIEDEPRGIYAGALGLVDVRGFALLALCIRTAVHDGERYSIQASAGVVADSEPAAEWQETLAKLSATHWALTGEELLP